MSAFQKSANKRTSIYDTVSTFMFTSYLRLFNCLLLLTLLLDPSEVSKFYGRFVKRFLTCVSRTLKTLMKISVLLLLKKFLFHSMFARSLEDSVKNDSLSLLNIKWNQTKKNSIYVTWPMTYLQEVTHLWFSVPERGILHLLYFCPEIFSFTRTIREKTWDSWKFSRFHVHLWKFDSW